MVWCWLRLGFAVKKKSEKTKQKLRIDKYWSYIVRDKFNHTCIMCGKDKHNAQIHAHHCLVGKKAGGNSARYNLDNGVAMCYNCHMNKLHGRQDKDFKFYEDYVAKVKEIFTQGKIDDLRAYIKQTVIKDKDLNLIEDDLKKQYDSLQDML